MNRLNKRILIFIFLLLAPNLLFGAVENPDGILSTLNSHLSKWIPNIKTVCLYVFYTLVVIDIVWTFGEKALKGFELGDFIATLIKKIMYIGIFLFLFNTDLWLRDILNGFSSLSTQVNSGVKVTPSTILSAGFTTVIKIIKSMDFDIPLSLLKAISGIIIIIGFVFMAIDLLIVYLKFYLLNIICFFAFALGGLSHFKQLGLNPVLATIKIGIEVFLIQGFMGLAIVIIDTSLANIKKYDAELIMSILAMSVIFCMITKMIPGMIEAVMNGGIGETAGASAGFRAVAATAAGIAAGTVIGGGSKTIRALSEANKLNNATGANEGKGKLGKFGNAFKTAYNEVKEQHKSNFGKSQVSESLREKTKAAQASKVEGTIGGDKNSKNESYASGVEK